MRRLALVLLAGCATAATAPPHPATVTLTIIGTSDLHGHIGAEGDYGGVALLGGYVANVRAARAADGGGVLLLDAGDEFHGTLESNLNEGHAVVMAYNELGYQAMSIGNHDFDYGPVGPRVVALPGEDPRGALRARAAEARYPFLTSNVIDEATGKPLGGKNIMPSTMVEVAGLRIGVVGAATTDTPTSTLAENFRGLRLEPLAPAIVAEAEALRARGAQLVVLTTHSGLCSHVTDEEVPRDCTDGELAGVMPALAGHIDAVVAGHTHSGVTARIAGIDIIEAWKYGRGFGRIDLTVDRATGKVLASKAFLPRQLCARVVAGTERCDRLAPAGERVAASYEGAPVVADARLAGVVQPFIDAARARRDEKLGVRVAARVPKSYDSESPFGNLVADLMRAARPEADVAITNGGGLRTDLDAGELTYGRWYETYPFDNRFATIRLRAGELRRVLQANLEHSKGILSLSGMRTIASCKDGKLAVVLERSDGRPVAEDERIVIVTSDFLAGGGDGTLGGVPDAEIKIEDDGLVRDVLVDLLIKRGGVLRPETYYDPAHPRIAYPGRRPVRCQ